jgi:hypothetical protein
MHSAWEGRPRVAWIEPPQQICRTPQERSTRLARRVDGETSNLEGVEGTLTLALIIGMNHTEFTFVCVYVCCWGWNPRPHTC